MRQRRIGVAKWIESVCLQYNVTDRRIELYLRQFFQLIGVYTYEQRVDVKNESNITSSDYFADIVILSAKYIQNHGQFLEDYSENTIWIVEDKRVYEILDEVGALENKNVFLCDFKCGREKLILNLIECLENIYVRENTEEYPFFDEWKILGKIYINENMFDHMYLCEHFIPDDKLFLAFSEGYSDVVDEILKKWKESSTKGLYFRYAIIYIAYSINAYCKRNNDTYIYNTNNLNELVMSLVSDIKNNRNVMLLQAKIKNDLLNDTESAKIIYEELKGKVNWGEIYYDLGQISEQKEHDYLKAMRYYQESIKHLSEKSYSIYRIAKCWYKMGEKMKAVSAWQEVIILLNAYCQVGSMSLLEGRCLYKSAMEIGDMLCIEDKRSCEAALTSYKLAEMIYDMIEKNSVLFLEDILEKYSLNELRDVMKKTLNRMELQKKSYYAHILQKENKEAREYLEKMRKKETEEE